MADLSVSSEYDGLNLPFSVEAEQSVLGAIIIEPPVIDKIIDILPDSSYFYMANHRIIYDAVLDMNNSGKTIDFVTILERLKQEKEFDEASGKTYLLQLAEVVPSISNVEAYAKIIKEKYDIRSLIMAARDIIEEAGTGGNDSETLLDSAEQRIFDIRRGKSLKGIEKISDVIIKTFDRLDLLNSKESESIKPISTGISDLDRTITGLNRSDLIILAARPGMGKTSFALNIANFAAVKEKKKVVFFSLEMTNEQLVSRLLSTQGQIEGKKLRTGKLSGDEWTRLVEAGDILAKTEIYIDDTPGITVPAIKAKLRRLKDADLVIIDYLQLMSSARRIDNKVQEISEITRTLKILAKEINVPLITLSQLSRASEQRAEHRPQISDLRDSGSIEQDADIILFLYREGYYEKGDQDDSPLPADQNSGECIVAKNRHGESGTVKLHWQGEYMRFSSPEERYEE